MKIQPKLMLLMAGSTVLTVVAAISLSLTLGSSALEHEIEEKLRAVRDARQSEISEYLARVRRDTYLQGVDPKTVEVLQAFSEAFAQRGDKAQSQLQQGYIVGNPHPAHERFRLNETGERTAYDRLHAHFHPYLREKAQVKFWEDLLLVDRKGNVVYSMRKNPDFATNLVSGPWKDSGLARAVLPLLKNPVYGQPAFADFSNYGPNDNRPAAFLAMPVFHPVDGPIGAAVVQLPSERINTLMRQRIGLGESGENFLVGPDGWMLSDSRYEKTSTILRKQLKTQAVDNLLKGRTDLILAPDYRGVMSYIGLRPLTPFADVIGGNVTWGVIAKIDRDEALAPLTSLRDSLLLAGMLIALLAIGTAIFFARTVSQPILAIKKALTALVHGEESVIPCQERSDEIGSMARSAETFRELARKTAHDHWLQENVAALTAVVSSQSSMKQTPDLLLHQLCELLEVPVAAFYLHDGKGRYQQAGTHGLARRNQLADGFQAGESVLGQCARDAQPVILSPVPSGLSVISSGLAEFPPHELVLYPIVHKADVLAVIELAAVQPLTPEKHELLRVACEALGLHLANLQVSEHNRALLVETQAQSEKLHASAHYVRSLIEASLDPLVTISAEGKITDVNTATEKVTGVSSEKLIGSDFADYFVEPEKAREGYREAFTKGFVTDYALTIRHASGQLVDVLYNASVYRDAKGDVIGVFAAARDVTERNRAEAKLQLQQAELIQYSEEMRSQAEELKAQTEELKANQEELRAQQEEMAHKNQVLEIQGQQLDLARREAEAKAAELEQASQYKSEFLANMSHELRTPLNSILILARSLAENQEANLSPEQIESATVIHESGSHLLTLINDVLDLSKIEAGRLELFTEDFVLDEVLAYLRRVFSPLAEKRHLDFVIEVDSDLPETIHGDRQRITQVLTNLLSNAMKFTETGSVRIHAARQDDWLQVDVIDSGVGIPQDKIEHIFGVFQQLDGSTSRKYGGSGLGLAISRRLVELMGGRITVTSTPQQGSCFSIRIPLQPSLPQAQAPAMPAVVHTAAAAAQRPSSPPAASSAMTGSGQAASGGRILVVEDDSRLVRILERLIDTLGHAVTCTESGEEALAEVARERPAGILLDLGLPGISGMEVLRRLKEDPLTADIPVAIMSGAADTGEAKTLGAFTFLKKPVTREVIAGTLKAIGQQNAQQACKQVLLVEDNAATVLALRKLFQNDPVNLSPAASGKEALALLDRDAFDAVILDLGLPDMTGFEWLAHLEDKGAHLPPLIVYSARELGNEELLALRRHTETVIIKGRHANERLHEEVLLALHAPAGTSGQVAPHCPLTGHHLLLVDDDVRNLFALSKALRSRGYAVTVAESGERALKELRGGHFHGVLTDIMMPGIDGYELTRRIRELGYAELPIVAVTAKAMQGDQERCLQAGANAYVPKPVDIDRLAEILKDLL